MHTRPAFLRMVEVIVFPVCFIILAIRLVSSFHTVHLFSIASLALDESVQINNFCEIVLSEIKVYKLTAVNPHNDPLTPLTSF